MTTLASYADHFGSPGSTVTVKLGAATASIFSDAAGTHALANPMTLTKQSFVAFYAAPGVYTLIESGAGGDQRTVSLTAPPSTSVAASSVTFAPPSGMTSADVQAALGELQTSKADGATVGAALAAKADAAATASALATKADTTAVHNVPAGGATGQALKKLSATAYDYGWGDVAAGIAAYNPTTAYSAGQQVSSAYALWTALNSVTDTAPSETGTTIPASYVTAGNTSFAQQWLAVNYTPTVDTVATHIRVYENSSGLSSSRTMQVGIGAAVTVGSGVPVWTKCTDGTTDSVQSTTMNLPGVTGGAIDLPLAGPVKMLAGQTYSIAFKDASGLAIAVYPGGSGSGGAFTGLYYGTASPPSFAAFTSYSIWLQVRRAQTVAWSRSPVSPFKVDDTGTIILPASIGMSWLIGSDRMAYDGADTTKNARAFFEKSSGAFRAGSATGVMWDVRGQYSTAFGVNNQATGAASFSAGNSNIASGQTAVALGTSTVASGDYSTATGSATTASGTGASARGANGVAPRQYQEARGSGAFTTSGDSQAGAMVMRWLSTDATPGVLRSSPQAQALTYSGTTTNVLTLNTSQAMRVHVLGVARRTDVQGEVASFSIDLTLAREAGNIRIVGSQTTASSADAAAATWTLVASVDTANQALVLTATGEAGKTIRWVADVQWVEVG